MNVKEVESYLSVSSQNSIVIDCSVIKSLGGMIRTTSILPAARVNIEFDIWGYDEGGIYFSAEYEDLHILIADMEEFLSTPIGSWQNISKTGYYPKKPEVKKVSNADIVSIFNTNKSFLPVTGEYALAGSYWVQMFNEYNKK